MMRSHEDETLDRYEDVRFIAFCSLVPYMEKGTTVQKFWAIPRRDRKPVDEEKISDAKKFMDEVTEEFRKFYNR